MTHNVFRARARGMPGPGLTLQQQADLDAALATANAVTILGSQVEAAVEKVDGMADQVGRQDVLLKVENDKPGRSAFLVPVPGEGNIRRAWSVGDNAEGQSPLWGDTEGRVRMKRAGKDMIDAVGGRARGFTFGRPGAVVDQNGVGFFFEPPLTQRFLAFEIAGAERDIAVIEESSGRTARLTYQNGDNFAPERSARGLRWVRRSGSSLSVIAQSLSIENAAPVTAGVKTIWQVVGIGNSNMQGAESYPIGDPDGVIAPGRVMEFSCGVNPGGNGLVTVAADDFFGPLNDMESGAYLSTETDAGTTMIPRLLAGTLSAIGPTGAMLGTALGLSGLGYDFVKKGTDPYKNVLTAIRQGRRLGFIADLDHRVPHFAMLHGEADRGAFKADYLAYLNEWQADFQTDLRAILLNDSFVLPFLLSQMSGWTYYNDIASGRSEVPLAQLQVALDSPSKFLCIGPRYHLPYYNSGPHLTRDGQRKHGDEFARAARALMSSFDGAGNPNGAYLPLHVASGTRAGTTVTLQTAGKVGNLEIDTSLVTDPGNFGITYRDMAGNPVVVSSVEVADAAAGTISFTIASAVAGVAEIAMRGTPGAAPGATTGPRACFRDNSPETTTVDGSRLYKRICHGEVPIA